MDHSPAPNASLHTPPTECSTPSTKTITDTLSESCPYPLPRQPLIFEYAPLEGVRHVRVLRLGPELVSIKPENTGDVKAAPNCALIHADLSDVQPYTAISYTWEPEAKDRRISIDNRNFTVKENVFDLLVALRQPSEARYLWLDAICINQADQNEKGRQIGMMGDIYESASYVICHLWSSTILARDSLRRGSIALREAFEDRTSTLGRIAKKTEYADWPSDEDPANDKWPWQKSLRDLSSLYKHRYWRRRWVIQETILARALFIYAGDTEIPASLLRAFTDMCCNQPLLLETLRNFPAILRGGEQSAFLSGNRNLLQAISLFKDTQCAVPNDQVFSLIALSPVARELFQVDYALRSSELSCYTLKFSLQKEKLSTDEAVRFASILVRQLNGTTDFTRLTTAYPEQNRDVFGIPCLSSVVSSVRLNSSLAAARAHFARYSMLRLPPSSEAWLETTRPHHEYQLLAEVAYSQALVSSQRTLLEAFTFTVCPSVYGAKRTPRPEFLVGLSNSRAEAGDHVWQLPGVALGLLVRSSGEGHEALYIAGLVHLLEEPTSGSGIRSMDWAMRTWPGLGPVTEAAAAKGKVEPDDTDVRILHITIPTLLCLAQFANYIEPAI